jgi:hypothetical protein
MNDQSQVVYHMGKELLPDCEVNSTEEGYQAMCPTCPWTSGIHEYKGSAKLRYYRHLEYIEKGLHV